jgi:hypothetical protein
MSGTASIRTQLQRVAFRVESTPGVDVIGGGTPAAADYVTGRATIRFVQDTSANPGLTGAYDDLPPIPGGLRAEVSVSVPLAGSGTPGTAPEWGKLLRACRMIETVTGAAVGAPTAAASGTATTVTAATPFSTTAQQYRGMPLLITGTPVSQDIVLDYTAGRVITLARTYSPVLSASALLQVPINVLYSPTSDETLEQYLTCYGYVDGLRHRITGMKGTFGVGLRSGAPAELMFMGTGIVVARDEPAALPTNFVPVTRQPPRWAGGMAQLNRSLVSCQGLRADMNVRTYYPENPEAAEGYDVPIITGAGPRITVDPFSHVTNSPLRSNAFRAGTPVPVAAMWGTVAGNRFALSCPSGQIIDLQEAERGSLRVDSIVVQPDQGDASIFLAQF